jgi:acyl-CoA synthetase (AMP-forming)/AMP-acid ligase II
MLLGDILRRDAKLFGKKIGLIDEGRNFTYDELNRRVNRLANGLIRLGFEKGSRVAVMADNCHEFVEAYFAIAKVGLVIVPVSSRLTAAEVSYIIDHSDSVVMMYQEEFQDVVHKIKEDIPQIKYFLPIGNGDRTGGNDYESFLEKFSEDEPEGQFSLREDDMVMIMYTSGATGRPKGVMTSHRNILANTITLSFEHRIVPEDVTLLVMPLYHNGGLWPLMVHFYRGGRVILLQRFDVERVLDLVEKEKVTLLNLVPTALIRLISHPDLNQYNLDSLRTIMYAGAPIALSMIREAMQKLGEHRFYTGLGSTEASGSMLSLPNSEHALEGPMAEKLSSVGRDSINVEVRVVDPQGRNVKIGEVGEIIAKGDNIALGYWKLPVETAETFRNGWLYTGDMARVDSDGYVYIVDRKKDMIISGGENISSKEVEDVIFRHPAVHEAAVIGVPDEEWGESVKALVALKPGMKATEQEIIDFCKDSLSSFKKPKSVDFLDEIPKNPAGKVHKAELREKYWRGREKKI